MVSCDNQQQNSRLEYELIHKTRMEALNRVLPFTAKEDNRPVLQCVLFKAGEGKLTMASADGFRLAVVTLDYDGEGEALINTIFIPSEYH
ncbi:hypothetical protein ACFLVN_05960 [Chloroflexota bacterium]